MDAGRFCQGAAGHRSFAEDFEQGSSGKTIEIAWSTDLENSQGAIKLRIAPDARSAFSPVITIRFDSPASGPEPVSPSRTPRNIPHFSARGTARLVP